MNWKKFWNNYAIQTDNPQQKVGRTVNQNQPIGEKQFIEIIKNIHNLLNIKEDEVVLDVCCGNGLLSFELSKYCKTIIGVDQSKVLINEAKILINDSKIRFIEANALELTKKLIDIKFDKIILYFSFQYFDNYWKGKKVIREMLQLLKSDGIILIGDIPDKSKIDIYYNSKLTLIKYHIKFLLGIENMGKFWNKLELNRICKSLNVKGKFIEQPKSLPYSHYRFDYTIEK